MKTSTTLAWGLGALATFALPSLAAAQEATPGYPEKVLHWTVEPGETCNDVSAAVYGSPKHHDLLQRYNAIDCGLALPPGATLVVPAKVTKLPTARLRAMHPQVRARPAGGGWQPAAAGMALHDNESVNTLEDARADIFFVDRTRVYLAEHTLVVIYGTAGKSRVAKARPVRVELESGEVQAGLAALRGDRTMEVGVKGGAQVSAKSRDSVVRKKKQRSTVSVFDGSAKVASAGKSVSVPEKFGTSFEEKKPPTVPRPLPPAPLFGTDSSHGVVLAPGGIGKLVASWSEVPRAVSYRVEVAKDASFHDLIVREEVPARIRSFRAEKLPAGNYWLRVRAIDDEDFLGLASPDRGVTLLAAKLGQKLGNITPGKVEAHPYGVLELTPVPRTELSVDGGPFGPVPKRIDLLTTAPNKLVFRERGQDDTAIYDVSYAPVSAHLERSSASGEPLEVSVTLQGFDGVDVAQRVKPELRAHLPSGLEVVPLVAANRSSFSARIAGAPEHEAIRVDVVDGRGRVLGTAELDRGARGEEPVPTSRRQRPIGITAPPLIPSPALSIRWWTPMAQRAGYFGVTAGAEDGSARGQAHGVAMGHLGDVGVDALLASGGLGDAPEPDDAAWLGLRWRAMHSDGGLELAPALRVAIPSRDGGAPARVELGLALGSRHGRFAWVGDAGGRARLQDQGASSAPDGQGFLLLGGSYDATPWLTAYGLLDGHALFTDELAGRAGLSLGMEAGGSLFAGLGGRLSPWDDGGGVVFGQLSLGVREGAE